jgi:F-box interacting protein
LFISTQTRSVDLEASLDDDSSLVSLNLNVNDYSRINVKGSCRGFVFLHCSTTFYIWNPSTGVYKQIPLCSNLDFDYFYGFGYDQLTDDYLVVSMSDDYSPQLLEFFSFRGNTWKQIKGTHIQSIHAIEGDQKVGLFFNGAIHWFAHCLDLQKDVIVAFDLMERKLLDMHLPDHFGFEGGLWVGIMIMIQLKYGR